MLFKVWQITQRSCTTNQHGVLSGISSLIAQCPPSHLLIVRAVHYVLREEQGAQRVGVLGGRHGLAGVDVHESADEFVVPLPRAVLDVGLLDGFPGGQLGALDSYAGYTGRRGSSGCA